jgi:septin family protein
VNLIPVLSRADTLTKVQTKKLKQAILKDAAEHQIQFFQFLSPKLAKKLLEQQQGTAEHEHSKKKRISRQGPGDEEEAEELGGDEDEEEEEEEEEEDEDEDEWDPETLEEKAHLQSLTPFTVIAKEEDVDIKDSQGNAVQGREFPWGVLNCFDSKHCDLQSLRSALLSSHRQELKEITYGYFYEKYRTEKLLARTKSQHIQLQQLQQQQQQQVGSTTSLQHKPSLLKNGSTLTPKESMLSIGSGSPIAGPWEE